MDTLKVVLNKFVSHFRPHYSSTKQEVKSKGVLQMRPTYYDQEKQKRKPAIFGWFTTTLNGPVMLCISC